MMSQIPLRVVLLSWRTHCVVTTYVDRSQLSHWLGVLIYVLKFLAHVLRVVSEDQLSVFVTSPVTYPASLPITRLFGQSQSNQISQMCDIFHPGVGVCSMLIVSAVKS